MAEPVRAYKSWTVEETDMLKKVVTSHGSVHDWTAVATMMPGRTSKQCRDRWVNYIAEGTSKQKWSPEEDKILAAFHALNGPKWSKLSRMLPGRTQLSIKNRWHSVSRSKLCHRKPPSLLHAYVKELRTGSSAQEALADTVGQLDTSILAELSSPGAQCRKPRQVVQSMSCGDSESTHSSSSCSGSLPCYPHDHQPHSAFSFPYNAFNYCRTQRAPGTPLQPPSPSPPYATLPPLRSPTSTTTSTPSRPHNPSHSPVPSEVFLKTEDTTASSSTTPITPWSNTVPFSQAPHPLLPTTLNTTTLVPSLATNTSSRTPTLTLLQHPDASTAPQQPCKPPTLLSAHGLQHLAASNSPQQPYQPPKLLSAHSLQQKAAYFANLARLHLRAASSIHTLHSTTTPPNTSPPTLNLAAPYQTPTSPSHLTSFPPSRSMRASQPTTNPPSLGNSASLLAGANYWEPAVQLTAGDWSSAALYNYGMCSPPKSSWLQQQLSQAPVGPFNGVAGISTGHCDTADNTGQINISAGLIGTATASAAYGVPDMIGAATQISSAEHASQNCPTPLSLLDELPAVADGCSALPQMLSDAEFQALCAHLLQ